MVADIERDVTQSIAAVLFDKDGTLLGYDASWGPVNRELAAIAAKGDPVLADQLLAACGMDPVTGHVVPDSLLAAAIRRKSPPVWSRPVRPAMSAN